MANNLTGKISQVLGAVVDIEFDGELPAIMNALEVDNHGTKLMLEVAQQIRGALDGELKDDHRSVMTAQTIEHYRQRIRDFELRQLKAAGSRA